MSTRVQLGLQTQPAEAPQASISERLMRESCNVKEVVSKRDLNYPVIGHSHKFITQPSVKAVDYYRQNEANRSTQRQNRKPTKEEAQFAIPSAIFVPSPEDQPKTNAVQSECIARLMQNNPVAQRAYSMRRVAHAELNNRFELMCPSDMRVGQMVLKPIRRPVDYPVLTDYDFLQQADGRKLLTDPETFELSIYKDLISEDWLNNKEMSYREVCEDALAKNETLQGAKQRLRFSWLTDLEFLLRADAQGLLTKSERSALSVYKNWTSKGKTLDPVTGKDKLIKNETLQLAIQRLRAAGQHHPRTPSKCEPAPSIYASQALIDEDSNPLSMGLSPEQRQEAIRYQRFWNVKDRRSVNYNHWRQLAAKATEAQQQIEIDARNAKQCVDKSIERVHDMRKVVHAEFNNRFELMCPSDIRVGQLVLKPVSRPIDEFVLTDFEFLQRADATKKLTDTEHLELVAYNDLLRKGEALDPVTGEDKLAKNEILQRAAQKLGRYNRTSSKREPMPSAYALQSLTKQDQLGITFPSVSRKNSAAIQRFWNAKDRRYDNYDYWRQLAAKEKEAHAKIEADKRDAKKRISEITKE